MKIEDLRGKKVLVMGLGLHGGGIGTVRFLCSAGAHVIVTDLKTKEQLANSLDKIKDLKGIEYVFGQHRPEDFLRADLIIKTPPIPWNNKYIKAALEKKIPVEIDAGLFFKLNRNPVVGITGTKGKTTTSSFIYEIIKNSGKNTIKVGVGQISVLDKLLNLKKDSLVIFELSSWRLSALGKAKISPQVAVLTNIYPDHLNYYKTMEDYIQDKKFIFLNQKPKDFCILNWDNEILRKMEPEIKSQIIKFSRNKISNGKSVYINEGAIYLNNGIDEKKIIDLSEVGIKGEHNLENILAGIGVAYALGIDANYIKKTIATFKGIAHRLEFVREVNGIKYYNDTSATTPESAIFGIEAFINPVVLICGGSDKNLNMSPLVEKIAEKVKGVVFLKGKATEKIIIELERKFINSDLEKKFIIADSMEKAVEFANQSAETGDVVLLSPGAASFGIFANEFERGDKFKEAVKKLK